MLVFNELSVRDIEPTISKEYIYSKIECFLLIYKRIRKELSEDIYTSDDMKAIIINNTSLSEWKVTQGVDEDLKRIYRSMCDRQQIIQEDQLQEVLYNNHSGVGLLKALSYKGICLSFNINSEYTEPILHCELIALDDAGEYIDNNRAVSVNNLALEAHIYTHRDFIDEYNKISTPSQLLSKLEERFPNLIFIDTAKTQIENDIQKSCIKPLIEKLDILDEHFRKLQDGFNCNNMGVKCVDESPTNLQKLSDKYTFIIDGEKKLARYHIYYTTPNHSDGRIYFYPCTSTTPKKAYICSLTRKIENI